ncbi:unnamed protein product [Closterium sp. NIES-54]
MAHQSQPWSHPTLPLLAMQELFPTLASFKRQMLRERWEAKRSTRQEYGSGGRVLMELGGGRTFTFTGPRCDTTYGTKLVFYKY